MYRFFIQPEDLIRFIMLAFNEGKDGDVWIPKMREISIMDAIHEGVPDDYPIIEVGRRKGEKLREKLFSNAEKVEEFESYWIIRNEKPL